MAGKIRMLFFNMKSFLVAVSCVVAIVLLLIAVNHKSRIISNHFKYMNINVFNRKFDAALWKAQYKKNKRKNPRISMVSYLEPEVLQKGMDREVVRQILGSPEQIRENADLYDLGASPFGIDYEQYVIEYDRNNKVVKIFTIRG